MSSSKPVKIILTRVENLPVKEQAAHGLTGRVVVEVTKNSPTKQDVVKVERYTDYFEKKFTQEGMTAEKVRELAKKF